MEMLQRKLADSELKRAEAVKQLKSLSVSEAKEIVARHYTYAPAATDTVQSAERPALQLDASRNRINHFIGKDY